MSQQRTFRADSLFLGMSIMLVMTVIQRGIGFARGVWFCQLLDDAALGKWAMGYGFLSLVTPMLLLGLPGTLPRFVEHFRQQGQLAYFLRQMLGATALVATVGVSSILFFAARVGQWVFGDSHDLQLVSALSVAVVAVVIFNATNQVVAGLRMVRVASTMQFVQGVAFTFGGVSWLWSGGAVAGLMLMFAAATILATAPAWWALARGWSAETTSPDATSSRSMWRRVLPYAGALWVMNFLSNTFELTDRYMLLHLAAEGQQVGQRLVGQYHSSMIIPALTISLATMASGVVMPYLAADWERGRRRSVAEKLRKLLVGTSVAFTALGAAALWLAPWIYGVLLEGRYDDGLAVLPVVFVFCIWCSLGILAQDYLWVAERGRVVGAVLGAGLLINLAMNGLLVPRIGLSGAVWGTFVSHLFVLAGIWWANARCGFRLDRSAAWVTLLPATLLAGPYAAAASIVAMGVTSTHARRYLRQLGATAGCQFGLVAR